MAESRILAWIESLADHAIALHQDGVHDPSAEDIAAKSILGGGFVPPGLEDDVRRILRRVRTALTERGYRTIPLPGTYYKKFRRRTTLSADQASLCDCRTGKRAVGIGFVDGDPKMRLIFEEQSRREAKMLGGNVQAVERNLAAALDRNHLSREKALAIVRTLREHDPELRNLLPEPPDDQEPS